MSQQMDASGSSSSAATTSPADYFSHTAIYTHIKDTLEEARTIKAAKQYTHDLAVFKASTASSSHPAANASSVTATENEIAASLLARNTGHSSMPTDGKNTGQNLESEEATTPPELLLRFTAFLKRYTPAFLTFLWIPEKNAESERELKESFKAYPLIRPDIDPPVLPPILKPSNTSHYFNSDYRDPRHRATPQGFPLLSLDDEFVNTVCSLANILDMDHHYCVILLYLVVQDPSILRNHQYHTILAAVFRFHRERIHLILALQLLTKASLDATLPSDIRSACRDFVEKQLGRHKHGQRSYLGWLTTFLIQTQDQLARFIDILNTAAVTTVDGAAALQQQPDSIPSVVSKLVIYLATERKVLAQTMAHVARLCPLNVSDFTQLLSILKDTPEREQHVDQAASPAIGEAFLALDTMPWKLPLLTALAHGINDARSLLSPDRQLDPAVSSLSESAVYSTFCERVTSLLQYDRGNNSVWLDTDIYSMMLFHWSSFLEYYRNKELHRLTGNDADLAESPNDDSLAPYLRADYIDQFVVVACEAGALTSFRAAVGWKQDQKRLPWLSVLDGKFKVDVDASDASFFRNCLVPTLDTSLRAFVQHQNRILQYMKIDPKMPRSFTLSEANRFVRNRKARQMEYDEEAKRVPLALLQQTTPRPTEYAGEYFQELMFLMGDLYASKPELALAFWSHPLDGFLKWVTNCPDIFVKDVFYMLKGLATGSECAEMAHAFMSLPSQIHQRFSWYDIFGALDKYMAHCDAFRAQQLQKKAESSGVMLQMQKSDLECLSNALRLAKTIVRFVDGAKKEFFVTRFKILPTLFGLVSSGIPLELKRRILNLLTETVKAGGALYANDIWSWLDRIDFVSSDARKQSAKDELEFVESPHGSYSFTKGLLRLTHALVQSKLFHEPDDALAARFRPYLQFLLEDVTENIYRFSFKNFADLFKLLKYSLSTVVDLLRAYNVKEAPATSQKPARLSQYPHTFETAHPGYHIMMKLVSNSNFFTVVQRFTSFDLDLLDKNMTGNTDILLVVQSGLEILNLAFEKQDEFLKRVAVETSQVLNRIEDCMLMTRSITQSGTDVNPENQLFLETSTSSRGLGSSAFVPTKAHILQIVRYISVEANLRIPYFALKIMRWLCEVPRFKVVGQKHRLLSIIESAEETAGDRDGNIIVNGFLNRLEIIRPVFSLPPYQKPVIIDNIDRAFLTQMGPKHRRGGGTGSLSQDNASMRDDIRMQILELLNLNVDSAHPSRARSSPNLAHYLLIGYDMRLRDAYSVVASPRHQQTCLHVILDMLRPPTTEQPTLFSISREVAEECYTLMYKVCENPDLRPIFMNYLRLNEDFFKQQLFNLPLTYFDLPASIVPTDELGAPSDRLFSDVSKLRDMRCQIQQLRIRALTLQSVALDMYMSVSNKDAGPDFEEYCDFLMNKNALSRSSNPFYSTSYVPAGVLDTSPIQNGGLFGVGHSERNIFSAPTPKLGGEGTAMGTSNTGPTDAVPVMKLIDILQSMTFKIDPAPGAPFDSVDAMFRSLAYKECRRRSPRSGYCLIYDIDAIRGLLKFVIRERAAREIPAFSDVKFDSAGLPFGGYDMSAAFPALMQYEQKFLGDVEKIIRYFLLLNHHTELVQARYDCLVAWSDVTNLAITEAKDQFVVWDVLQALVDKVPCAENGIYTTKLALEIASVLLHSVTAQQERTVHASHPFMMLDPATSGLGNGGESLVKADSTTNVFYYSDLTLAPVPYSPLITGAGRTTQIPVPQLHRLLRWLVTNICRRESDFAVRSVGYVAISRYLSLTRGHAGSSEIGESFDDAVRQGGGISWNTMASPPILNGSSGGAVVDTVDQRQQLDMTRRLTSEQRRLNQGNLHIILGLQESRPLGLLNILQRDSSQRLVDGREYTFVALNAILALCDVARLDNTIRSAGLITSLNSEGGLVTDSVVSGASLLEEPVSIDYVLHELANNGFIMNLVKELREEDSELVSFLDPATGMASTPAPNITKMIALIHIATRRQGAESLLDCGIMEILGQCQYLNVVRPSENSPLWVRWITLFHFAVKLVVTILDTCGSRNFKAIQKAALFAEMHSQNLLVILSDRNSFTSVIGMQAAEIIVALFHHLANDEGVLLSIPQYANIHTAILLLFHKAAHPQQWLHLWEPKAADVNVPLGNWRWLMKSLFGYFKVLVNRESSGDGSEPVPILFTPVFFIPKNGATREFGLPPASMTEPTTNFVTQEPLERYRTESSGDLVARSAGDPTLTHPDGRLTRTTIRDAVTTSKIPGAPYFSTLTDCLETAVDQAVSIIEQVRGLHEAVQNIGSIPQRDIDMLLEARGSAINGLESDRRSAAVSHLRRDTAKHIQGLWDAIYIIETSLIVLYRQLLVVLSPQHHSHSLAPFSLSDSHQQQGQQAQHRLTGLTNGLSRPGWANVVAQPKYQDSLRKDAVVVLYPILERIYKMPLTDDVVGRDAEVKASFYRSLIKRVAGLVDGTIY